MRKFKLIRRNGSMGAHTWDSVSIAANSTKMVSDFVDSVAISNLVNNSSLDFAKKPNKSITFAFKHKPLLNNSNCSNSSYNNNNNNTHKISTTNSNAGDWFEAKTFGD
tara:strand:+ start:4761 stop:5084 length:324 start_codon:yes stop_codon:yes gene_type:complete